MNNICSYIIYYRKFKLWTFHNRYLCGTDLVHCIFKNSYIFYKDCQLHKHLFHNVFINVYRIYINFLKNNKILSYADLKNNFIDSS